MKYFFEIENRTGDYWKADLVIESFKKINLEKDLFIGIKDSAGNYRDDFGTNLLTHKNIIKIPSLKNNFYKFLYFIENNIFNEDLFVLTKTHFITQKLPELEADFVFSSDREINHENLMKHNLALFDKFLPVGNCYYFKKLKKEFFEKTIEIYEYLISIQGDFVWEKTEGLALGLAALSFKNEFNLSVRGMGDLEEDMTGLLKSFFINIKHGLKPVFYNELYEYGNFITLGENPIKLLAKIAKTPASHFTSTVASNLLKRQGENEKNMQN